MTSSKRWSCHASSTWPGVPPRTRITDTRTPGSMTTRRVKPFGAQIAERSTLHRRVWWPTRSTTTSSGSSMVNRRVTSPSCQTRVPRRGVAHTSDHSGIPPVRGDGVAHILRKSITANIPPTDFGVQGTASGANGDLAAAKAHSSGLQRRSDHPLKVGTRVRTPLGLLRKACRPVAMCAKCVPEDVGTTPAGRVDSSDLSCEPLATTVGRSAERTVGPRGV